MNKFPKELILEIPIDEKQEFLKIKEVFTKYHAIDRTHPIGYETLQQEQINEVAFKKMIRKEYIRRIRNQYYYDIRMENTSYRRYIRNLRIMIYGMIFVYAIFIAMLVGALL